MKKLGVLALAVLFSGCATTRQGEPIACDGQQSYQRGLREAEKPDFSFLERCSAGTAALAEKRYKEGLAAARSRPKAKAVTAAPESEPNRVVQTLDTSSWICEVEASKKVFTGVGASLNEAIRSAKDTCGSHFQSSFCSEAQCKKSL